MEIIGRNLNWATGPIRTYLRKQTVLWPLTAFLKKYTVPTFNASDLRVMRCLYCMEETSHLGGDIAECGIGSGYSQIYILSYLNESTDTRDYHGFDTFEGFPFIDKEDLEGIPDHRRGVSVVGRYKEYPIAYHQKRVNKLGMVNRATLHKGLFNDTIPKLPEDLKFSFVFMDCDLYQSYRSCLDSMYDRVLSGGIILFDEYEHTVDWPGAKKAIDEFFADKTEKPEPLPFGTSWVVRKV